MSKILLLPILVILPLLLPTWRAGIACETDHLEISIDTHSERRPALLLQPPPMLVHVEQSQHH